jgi:hypothetical protein
VTQHIWGSDLAYVQWMVLMVRYKPAYKVTLGKCQGHCLYNVEQSWRSEIKAATYTVTRPLRAILEGSSLVYKKGNMVAIYGVHYGAVYPLVVYNPAIWHRITTKQNVRHFILQGFSHQVTLLLELKTIKSLLNAIWSCAVPDIGIYWMLECQF